MLNELNFGNLWSSEANRLNYYTLFALYEGGLCVLISTIINICIDYPRIYNCNAFIFNLALDRIFW